MKHITKTFTVLATLSFVCAVAVLHSFPLAAQVPGYVVQTTPDAQRTALNGVRTQLNWLEAAIKAAPGYGPGGSERIGQEFQSLRGAYGIFKTSLTPGQLSVGANEWAELDAGLDILEGAFGNYQADLAAGRPIAYALRSLGQVLVRGSREWERQFLRHCTRLHVGRP